MAQGNQLAAQSAKEYCRLYPAASNLQLARMLNTEMPKLFTSVDMARSCVRYCRGVNGKKSRKAGRDIVLRDELPQPAEEEWQRHTLPDGPKKWGIIADLHIPYYDRDALATMLDYLKDAKCDGLLLLGDVLDCYQLSTFDKDPRTRDPETEMSIAADALDVIKDVLKPKRIVWREANHEYRLQRYLNRVAPELRTLTRHNAKGKTEKAELVSIPYILDLDGRGITWIPHRHPIDYHHLTLLHGDEWGSSSGGVNPARTAFLKAGSCVAVAHSHRASEHNQSRLTGEVVVAYSIGCCCQLHPDYAAINQWQHGFGILHTNGSWKLDNLRLVNGDVR